VKSGLDLTDGVKSGKDFFLLFLNFQPSMQHFE